MCKSEALVIAFLGTARYDIRPFACAIDILAKLLFEYHLPKSSIYFTKHICPLTSLCVGKSCAAIQKSIYRTCALLWNAIYPNYVEDVFGCKMSEMPAPYDMLFFMACLLQHDEPFFHTLKGRVPFSIS